MIRRTALLAAAASLILFANSHAAEDRVYEPGFFESYAPQNALDMVNRVPGFALREGEDVRGFGGAAGNVLIDGARPSTKSSSLQDALRAIPASAVDRIEIKDAAASGIEAGGAALAVNVVRKASARAAGNVVAIAVIPRGDRVVPRGEVTWSGPVLEGIKGTFALKYGQNQGEYLVGREKITDGDGVLIEKGPNRDRRINWGGSASAAFEGGTAKEGFHLNALVRTSRFRRDHEIDAQDPLGNAVRFDEGADRSNGKGYEVGGDISRPGPFGGTWTLTGLANEDQFKEAYRFVSTDAGPNGAVGGSDFRSDSTRGERLAKLALAGRTGPHSWEAGLEAAYNFLDASQALFVTDGGPFEQVDLPIAQARVEEVRYEGTLRDSWAVNDTLSIEGILKLESSTISQSGDAAKERSFFYTKPAVAVSWRPNAGWTVRGRVERLVGQLNFVDFVSTSDVGDGTQNVGNPELQPDRTWRTELGVERRWGAKNAVELKLVYDQIDDAVGFIPIDNQFDAVGNIGDATRWGLDLKSTLQLDPVGVKNAEFIVNWQWRDTEVTDPVTGRERPLNGGRNFNAQFRHDIVPGKFSYGAEFNRGGLQRRFALFDTIVWPENQYVGLYAEAVPRTGVTVRVGVENPGGATYRRSRTVYNGSRALGDVAFTAQRERRAKPLIYARIGATL